MGHIKIGGGFNISYKTEFYKGSIHQKLENYLLKFGDVLMCMTDMKNNVRLLGHTALFFEQKYSYFVNQRVGLIREKSQDSSIKFSFIYCLTNSQNFLNDLRSRANSGVQVNLSSEHIKETKIISPDNSTAKKFDKLSRPLFKRIMINEGKIQSLTKTRDTLLPKLMSGEIRV